MPHVAEPLGVPCFAAFVVSHTPTDAFENPLYVRASRSAPRRTGATYALQWGLTHQLDHFASLGLEETDEARLGFCRRPLAAAGSGGRLQDVVPGDPDAPLLVFRMRSTQPDIKMPPIPSQLVDATGAEFITRWIAAMTPRACPRAARSPRAARGG